MMEFIPYKKLSKKQKREQNLKQRKTWAISPVTRKPDNPKAYNRSALKRVTAKWNEPSGGFLFYNTPLNRSISAFYSKSA